MYKATLFATALLLSSCAPMKSRLGALPETSTHNVTIVDNRVAQEKAYSREGIFTPIATLGDNTFDPSIVELLRSKLENESVSTAKKYLITVEKLKVIDYFHARIQAALAGAAAGQGYTYYSDFKGSDFVVFQFVGTVNGKDVKFEAAHPYKPSIFSMYVYNDDNFKEAVQKSIADVVLKISN
jgi:hypothetical protein